MLARADRDLGRWPQRSRDHDAFCGQLRGELDRFVAPLGQFLESSGDGRYERLSEIARLGRVGLLHLFEQQSPSLILRLDLPLLALRQLERLNRVVQPLAGLGAPTCSRAPVAVLQAFGVLDPNGKLTGRLDVVKAANVARLTQDDWRKQRDKMLATCNQCHSANFAKAELAKGDDMIREADHLMAEAIRVVAGLYQDATLPKPKEYAYAFPDR